MKGSVATSTAPQHPVNIPFPFSYVYICPIGTNRMGVEQQQQDKVRSERSRRGGRESRASRGGTVRGGECEKEVYSRLAVEPTLPAPSGAIRNHSRAARLCSI